MTGQPATPPAAPPPPLDPRIRFYRDCVRTFIPDRDGSVLVVAAGENDRRVLLELGFRNVVISNLDTRMAGHEFAPYEWSFQDAEALTFADGAFDYVLIHAGLHHCASPHRALLEMYRVARIGVLALEARDSWTMRLMKRVGVTRDYEHDAVVFNDCRFGGLRNTDVPNFVYRWTEAEVEKTINSFAPYARHRVSYRYGSAAPAAAVRAGGSPLRRAALRAALLAYQGYTRILPKQRNLFAFYVAKPKLPNDLFPWMTYSGGTARFSPEWAVARYKLRGAAPDAARDVGEDEEGRPDRRGATPVRAADQARAEGR
jgi:SAM-dependent methyltransferase